MDYSNFDDQDGDPFFLDHEAFNYNDLQTRSLTLDYESPSSKEAKKAPQKSSMGTYSTQVDPRRKPTDHSRFINRSNSVSNLEEYFQDIENNESLLNTTLTSNYKVFRELKSTSYSLPNSDPPIVNLRRPRSTSSPPIISNMPTASYSYRDPSDNKATSFATIDNYPNSYRNIMETCRWRMEINARASTCWSGMRMVGADWNPDKEIGLFSEDEVKNITKIVNSQTVTLIVGGYTNVGKSSFINLLLNSRVLPVEETPTTTRCVKIIGHPQFSHSDSSLTLISSDSAIGSSTRSSLTTSDISANKVKENASDLSSDSKNSFTSDSSTINSETDQNAISHSTVFVKEWSGWENSATIVNHLGDLALVIRKRLAQLEAEEGSRPQKQWKFLEVETQNPLLDKSIDIIECPATELQSNIEAVNDLFLAHPLSVFLYILDGSNILSAYDIAYLTNLKEKFPKLTILFLINKVDPDEDALEVDSYRLSSESCSSSPDTSGRVSSQPFPAVNIHQLAQNEAQRRLCKIVTQLNSMGLCNMPHLMDEGDYQDVLDNVQANISVLTVTDTIWSLKQNPFYKDNFLKNRNPATGQIKPGVDDGPGSFFQFDLFMQKLDFWIKDRVSQITTPIYFQLHTSLRALVDTVNWYQHLSNPQPGSGPIPCDDTELELLKQCGERLRYMQLDQIPRKIGIAIKLVRKTLNDARERIIDEAGSAPISNPFKITENLAEMTNQLQQHVINNLKLSFKTLLNKDPTILDVLETSRISIKDIVCTWLYTAPWSLAITVQPTNALPLANGLPSMLLNQFNSVRRNLEDWLSKPCQLDAGHINGSLRNVAFEHSLSISPNQKIGVMGKWAHRLRYGQGRIDNTKYFSPRNRLRMAEYLYPYFEPREIKAKVEAQFEPFVSLVDNLQKTVNLYIFTCETLCEMLKNSTPASLALKSVVQQQLIVYDTLMEAVYTSSVYGSPDIEILDAKHDILKMTEMRLTPTLTVTKKSSNLIEKTISIEPRTNLQLPLHRFPKRTANPYGHFSETANLIVRHLSTRHSHDFQNNIFRVAVHRLVPATAVLSESSPYVLMSSSNWKILFRPLCLTLDTSGRNLVLLYPGMHTDLYSELSMGPRWSSPRQGLYIGRQVARVCERLEEGSIPQLREIDLRPENILLLYHNNDPDGHITVRLSMLDPPNRSSVYPDGRLPFHFRSGPVPLDVSDDVRIHLENMPQIATLLWWTVIRRLAPPPPSRYMQDVSRVEQLIQQTTDIKVSGHRSPQPTSIPPTSHVKLVIRCFIKAYMETQKTQNLLKEIETVLKYDTQNE